MTRTPALPHEIVPGKKYSVFQVWTWEGPAVGRYVWSPNGHVSQNSTNGGASWAVRVLGVVGGFALSTDAYGKVTAIPVEAFGERIPDTTYLPGALLVVDGREFHVDQVISEDPEGYWITRPRSKRLRLFKHAGQWRFGVAGRVVQVRRA